MPISTLVNGKIIHLLALCGHTEMRFLVIQTKVFSIVSWNSARIITQKWVHIDMVKVLLHQFNVQELSVIIRYINSINLIER